MLGVKDEGFEEGSEAVYGKYLLMRTKAMLPPIINIPKDIPSLVQDVYDDNLDLEPEPAGYIEAKEKHKKLVKNKEKKAGTFRLNLPWPGFSYNLLGWLNKNITDQHGEAAVRDTDESIEVLLLQQKRDGRIYFLPWLEGGQELSLDTVPDRYLAMAIARQRIRLPRILCTPWNIDRTIDELERMNSRLFYAWQESAWLRGELILLLDHNFSAELCGYHLIYDKNLGLTYEKRLGEMNEKEFCLLHEPWIRVMEKSGGIIEVSLLDLFRYAHEFQRLAGELPTQDTAILRLLLAVLHAIFERYDLDGNYSPFYSPQDALMRWKSLWDRGSFPMNIINDYLLTFEDRFFLFHPEHSFYQVPELKKAGYYSAEKLNGVLSESDNKIRLFPQRTGESKSVLSYSEAARWLVHVNAFDDVSGSGKGRGETKRAKYELAWLAKLGLISAEGDNLFQTLLLNLIFLKDGGNELWGKSKPIWEQDVRTKESCKITIPDNLAELYTLQSRRLKLVKEGNVVTGYGLIGGDFFLKKMHLMSR